jgi:hypothetical protein
MLKEFTIGCSRTINLGNYESLRIEASVTIAVDENNVGEFPQIKRDAQAELRRLLEETYLAQHKKHNGT